MRLRNSAGSCSCPNQSVSGVGRVSVRSVSDLAKSKRRRSWPWYPSQATRFRKLGEMKSSAYLNFVSPCAKAYRRELIQAASIRFSPELFFGEDKLFNAEYLARVRRCAYCPAPVYYYNIHLDSSGGIGFP